MSTALDKIIEYKKEEVATLKASRSFESLHSEALHQTPPRGFAKRMQTIANQDQNALICEIKRKSPSAGKINSLSDPTAAAKAYEHGGAACISVLTDMPSFGGSLDDMVAVRNAVTLPVLRKDFMIDVIQILEARAHGADAILLIMSVLDDNQAAEMHSFADQLGMAVLLESHNEEELDRALSLPSPLIGVNNRDLKRMVTDLETTVRLSSRIPSEKLLISESGIKASEDIAMLRKVGARGFLIGESLMKSGNIANDVRELHTTS
ncbi:indole-3-glycerol phosphate synthase TrpC [Hirschia litorea]|uniref:Indole-3-glycerol phosphate synthase n=1 Tax=Hirschia litorea TaxID=1199156 RepID=A0ABW2IHS4_9PROT